MARQGPLPMAPAGAYLAGPRLLHMGKRDDEFRTAIHEAAHIITARELNVPVLAAHVGIRRGWTKFSTVDAAWEHSGDYRSGDTRAIAGAEIMITMAGGIGEELHGESGRVNEGDEMLIGSLRREFSVPDIRMKKLERRTRSLLLANWGNVIRIAGALLDRGTLMRSEIETILGR